MSRTLALDATLALLRALRHGPGECIAFSGWSLVDWETVVALASAHLVLPALAEPLAGLPAGTVPDDAAAFLVQMREANARRNAIMRADLIRVVEALNAIGIEPIVLKGGAWLIDEHRDTSWRFLGDLDLLVPVEAGQAASAALMELGLSPDDGDYDPQRDAHLPALYAKNSGIGVEIHTRLFAEPIAARLEAALPAAASRVSVGSAVLRLPAPPHRVAHLIVHSALHHHYYGLKRVLLRDHLELSHLTASGSGAFRWPEVTSLMETAREHRATGAFIASWRALMCERADGLFLSRADKSWAEVAIGRLYRHSAIRRLATAIDSGRVEIERCITNRAALRRHATTVLSLTAMRKRLSRRIRRFRQMHWA